MSIESELREVLLHLGLSDVHRSFQRVIELHKALARDIRRERMRAQTPKAGADAVAQCHGVHRSTVYRALKNKVA